MGPFDITKFDFKLKFFESAKVKRYAKEMVVA